MSDIMLNAVIQMPYEMAMNDELSRRQFYERANQAMNERNAKAAEIERLRKALEFVAEIYDDEKSSGENAMAAYEARNMARLALSGESNAQE